MTKAEKARVLRPLIVKAAQSLNDEDALEAKELYDEWKPEMECVKDTRLRYEDKLYRVTQTHTSQKDWTPDISPSLYAKVLIPSPDQIFPWEQPDSTNPYMKGDKVSHNDSIWESEIDNNVWEPGVYGWHKIEE